MTYTLQGFFRSWFHGATGWANGYRSTVVVLLCMLVLAFSSLGCKRGPCDPASTLKTQALYLQHVGDEDKPIEPIVIGAARPTTAELECAIPTPLISPYSHTYTVTGEEFSNALGIMEGFKDADSRAAGGEYRFVIVRGPGATHIGRLNRDQSKSLFASLQAYFKERRPDVYRALSDADRMF